MNPTSHSKFSRRAALIGLVPGSALTWVTTARAAAPSVETIRTPEGGIQPQAVVDRSGRIHLLSFSGDPKNGKLWYRTRLANSEQWSRAVAVNADAAGAVAMGTIRGGQLAVGGDGIAHVLWFGAQAGGGHGASPLLYSRLSEDGSRFEPARNLMRVSSVLDGGGSIAADSRGNVVAAWQAAEVAGGGEERRRLFIARSTDGGKNFSADTPAWSEPTGACACCSTRVFADSRGRFHVLYRSAQARVNRDMFLVSAESARGEFTGGRVDPWQIPACPMSSAAMYEGAKAIVAAWETDGQVRFGWIEGAAGRVARITSAPGNPGGRKHPSIAVNDAGEILLAWAEGTGWNRGGVLAWQQYSPAGQPIGAPGRIETGIPSWSLPSVVALPGGRFRIFH